MPTERQTYRYDEASSRSSQILRMRLKFHILNTVIYTLSQNQREKKK